MRPAEVGTAPGSYGDAHAFYRAYLQRCNEHRFDELGRFVAIDVAVNGVTVGRAAYAEGLRAVVSAFADHQWELGHLLVDGPWLSAHLHDTGTHTGPRWGIEATGRRIETQEFALYRIQDGRIAEVWVTADDLRVVDQLVRPEPGRAPAAVTDGGGGDPLDAHQRAVSNLERSHLEAAMSDPITGPIDAEDLPADADQQPGHPDDPDSLPPAQEEWVEENIGLDDSDSGNAGDTAR